MLGDYHKYSNLHVWLLHLKESYAGALVLIQVLCTQCILIQWLHNVTILSMSQVLLMYLVHVHLVQVSLVYVDLLQVGLV